jgi:NAD(P)-dependent dehydrogenase (short-subunit alcohol dehydrogenase family)
VDRRVAFVTGASRGIGKASAIALAQSGFDLVLCARTRREGERRERSPTLRSSDTRPLPGSLESTARRVSEAGREALALPMDLLDPESVDAAAAEALARWGHVDVLVNNAVYTGPGNLDRFLELPVDVVERIFRANVFSPIQLTRTLLPGMLQRKSGCIVNVTSHVAQHDPPAPAGAGGWGLGYAASKGAFHRMVGVLAVEHADSGLGFYNLDPGFVLTESMEEILQDQGFDTLPGAPPAVPAAVVAWLATSPEASRWNGGTIPAQELCAERGLLPGWP